MPLYALPFRTVYPVTQVLHAIGHYTLCRIAIACATSHAPHTSCTPYLTSVQGVSCFSVCAYDLSGLVTCLVEIFNSVAQHHACKLRAIICVTQPGPAHMCPELLTITKPQWIPCLLEHAICTFQYSNCGTATFAQLGALLRKMAM